MSKMMLIDERWLDKEIEYLENPVGQLTDFAENYRCNTISTLKYVKEQLQSPVDIVKEAFNAGREQTWTDINQEEREFVNDLDTYLKEKGYV